MEQYFCRCCVFNLHIWLLWQATLCSCDEVGFLQRGSVMCHNTGSVCVLFSACLSAFLPSHFLTRGKPNCFHTPDFKHTGLSRQFQFWAERKEWWAHVWANGKCNSHFPLLSFRLRSHQIWCCNKEEAPPTPRRAVFSSAWRCARISFFVTAFRITLRLPIMCFCNHSTST